MSMPSSSHRPTALTPTTAMTARSSGLTGEAVVATDFELVASIEAQRQVAFQRRSTKALARASISSDGRLT
jgi:hypothetical protein